MWSDRVSLLYGERDSARITGFTEIPKVASGKSKLTGIWKHCSRPVHACPGQPYQESFNLVDTLSVGVDRIQRNFDPAQAPDGEGRKTQITDDTAKLILYSAFIDGKLEAPRSLLPDVHRLDFDPQYTDLGTEVCGACRTLSPSAFKKLDPVPQFKATAKLGGFLVQLPN